MKARELKRTKTDFGIEKRKSLKKQETIKHYKSYLKMHHQFVCITVETTGRQGYMRQFGISRVTFREMEIKV